MYDEKKESHIKWKHKCQEIRNNKEQKRSLKETAVRKLGTHRKSTKKRTTECGREREQQNYKTNTPEIANHITFLKAFFMRLFLLIHFHFITLRFFLGVIVAESEYISNQNQIFRLYHKFSRE